MIAGFGRADLMLVGIELLLLLAGLVWIGVSTARIGRHIMAVHRRRASLSRRYSNLQRDLDTARHSVRQQETALLKADQALAEQEDRITKAQARLAAARADSLREYQVLTERFSDKDRLWLLSVERPGKPVRWAVAAPDQRTATDLLSTRVASSEKPAVDGKL